MKLILFNLKNKYDFILRVKSKNITVKYPPPELGYYTALKHEKDEPNPKR